MFEECIVLENAAYRDHLGWLELLALSAISTEPKGLCDLSLCVIQYLLLKVAIKRVTVIEYFGVLICERYSFVVVFSENVQLDLFLVLRQLTQIYSLATGTVAAKRYES